MKIDDNKIDDIVLALLQLTAHSDGYGTRAWKSQSWEVMDRLHQKGWISDPKNKNKSVAFTEEGLMRSQFMFREFFESGSKPGKQTKAKAGGPGAFRLRVTLIHSDPEIWREFCVPADLTLGNLHDVLQVVMGWSNDHLHQFIHKKKYIGVPMDDDWRDVQDENKVRLSEIFLRKGSRIEYEYDFGDGWIHEVVSLGKAKPEDPLFQVSDGAMACPPEDCGGIWGYYHLLEVLADPQHLEHEDYKTWFAGEIDPKAFDIDKVNVKLKKIFKKALSSTR